VKVKKAEVTADLLWEITDDPPCLLGDGCGLISTAMWEGDDD